MFSQTLLNKAATTTLHASFSPVAMTLSFDRAESSPIVYNIQLM
jgi:hypothetical protein